VGNDLFGNFHVNWAGTLWFRTWCHDEGPPEIAKLGDELIANQRMIVLHDYLYPKGRLGEGLAGKEWNRRALAAWYAILKNGVEHGDTLEYG